ncbi:succinylglutamate desuccinylase [Bacterioplanes sanyensis]|uniref:Succinylglutamate desuccinylase n=1 Tax=Bacterioplanes sanyensis TaxID=1249553 RepID=A0A222FFM0_9GAMM|nr:succinylglutamate desuccinylase [Bacterioplanes sanyensis]ASP37294.1 succinylglutamate desuccinylase [Bacterioplanes sanyensis]
MTHILQSNTDFLALSRQQPDCLTPGQFTLSNGTVVSVIAAGIIQFEPAATATEDVVLSCGVHGNETAPIEICDELVQRILRGELTVCQRVLVIFGNLAAMDIGQRFVEENMNRLFSGEHSRGPGLINDERRRAQRLEQAVAEFFQQGQGQRHHYDLHTAIKPSQHEKFAVYPYRPHDDYNTESLRFLAACDVHAILLSNGPTTTFSYYSADTFDAIAFTVELGKVRPFGENDMSRFAAAKDAITRLVCEPQPNWPSYRAEDFSIYKVNQVILRQQEDFRLGFGDDVPNFTAFQQGDVLAEESGALYTAQQDGEAIVFPNAKVALGQRAVLTLLPAEL